MVLCGNQIQERTRVRALLLLSLGHTVIPSFPQTLTPIPLRILPEPTYMEPKCVDAVEWASDLPMHTHSEPPTPSPSSPAAPTHALELTWDNVLNH